MKISVEGASLFIKLLELVRDVYRHPETTVTLRSYIKLRFKQVISRDNIEMWLDERIEDKD